MSKRIFATDLLPPARIGIDSDRLHNTNIENRKVISLGHRCEVAWQIRSFYDQPEAYPFDWLVTPLQSLPLMLDEQFVRIADPTLLKVVRYNAGDTVYNSAYDCFLHHEFRCDKAGYIVRDWQNDIQNVSLKFDYLRSRWRDLAGFAGKLYFVRRFGKMLMPSETLIPTSREDYRSVHGTLRRAFPLADVRLILIDCGDIGECPSIQSVEVGQASRADWPDSADLWKGKTIGYKSVFRALSS